MAYAPPADAIPVMLVWGGESDTYSSFSFDEANDLFSELLRNDGHFVMECDHGQGHTWPNGIQAHTWSFFKAHPKGEGSSPYESGLPGSYPDYCSLP